MDNTSELPPSPDSPMDEWIRLLREMTPQDMKDELSEERAWQYRDALVDAVLAIEFYMTTTGDDDEKIARCHERLMDSATEGRAVLQNTR